MSHWCKQVGEDFFEKLLQESLRLACESEALKTNQLKLIVVDTAATQGGGISYGRTVELHLILTCFLCDRLNHK